MRSTLKITLVFFLTVLTTLPINPQSSNFEEKTYIQALNGMLIDSKKFTGAKNTKMPGHYSFDDWQQAIDAYWGEGLPTTEKLEVFDLAIDKLDRTYAAFQNLDSNLDSLKNHYRPEIESGVSRGRFAAIMNHISLALKEAHTLIADIPVNFGTSLAQGVPLFVIGPWQDNSWFGAALTPLPDSSLLVYRVLPSHKLGLKQGDIVLGYDGIPWKELCKEILSAELPILPTGPLGSSDKSITHSILASAGLNWHLFDTIDIVKGLTNDTISLSTSLMNGQHGFIWGNEQLPVNGVQFPEFKTGDYVYWGIINGSNIGYIYVTSWNSDVQYNISAQFYNAIDSLMNVYQTKGIILDFRNNDGGWMGVAHLGYSLLFNESIYSVAFDIRAGDTDHFNMIPHPTYSKELFKIPGDPSSFYDKPIAVLTGPGSISNGDFESWRMKLHPKARTFGKPSCGAFATSIFPSLNHEDWFFYLTYGNSYPVNLPGQYLVHTDLQIDEEVWLTRQGVLNQNDDVVNKAVEWINSITTLEENDNFVFDYELLPNHPNPFNPVTTINYQIPKSGFVSLKVYDILGKEIATLVNSDKAQGKYTVEFDGSRFSSGMYIYKLQSGDFVEIRKMMMLK